MNELKQAMSSVQTSSDTINEREELAAVVTYGREKRHLAIFTHTSWLVQQPLNRGL